jgi:uncharacterized protein (DUF1330 family)
VADGAESRAVAKGYWIGHVDVLDPDPYLEYAKLAKVAVEKYGGVYLVRAGDAERVEGTWRERPVLIEFESYQRALDCYHSSDYQAAKRVRAEAGAAAVDLLIVEGSDNRLPGMK